MLCRKAHAFTIQRRELDYDMRGDSVLGSWACASKAISKPPRGIPKGDIASRELLQGEAPTKASLFLPSPIVQNQSMTGWSCPFKGFLLGKDSSFILH